MCILAQLIHYTDHVLGSRCINYPFFSYKQLNIHVSYCLAGASVLLEELVMCWQPLSM
jgi:hypothetical protein